MLTAPHRKLALGEISRVQRARNETYIDEFGPSGITVLADVTAAGSGNTKGAFAELVASTAFDSEWLCLYVVKNNTVVVADYLVDLAIGGAGSEVTFWSNVLFSTATSTEPIDQALIPYGIPAGTRVSARVASTDASAVIRVGLRLIKGGSFPGGLKRITTYGAETSDSGGTEVDPGGVSDTEGAWSELSSALTNPVEWGVVSIGSRNNGNIGLLSSARLDLGVGAAASEVVVVQDIPLKAGTVNDMWGPCLHSFPLKLPAGARLAARLQSNNTDNTDRRIDVAFYGID